MTIHAVAHNAATMSSIRKTRFEPRIKCRVRSAVTLQGQQKIVARVHEIIPPNPLQNRRAIGCERALIGLVVPPKSGPNPIVYFFRGEMRCDEGGIVSCLQRTPKRRLCNLSQHPIAVDARSRLRIERAEVNLIRSYDMNVFCLVIIDDISRRVGRKVRMQWIDSYIPHPGCKRVASRTWRVLVGVPNWHRRYFVLGDGPPDSFKRYGVRRKRGYVPILRKAWILR